MRDQMRKYHPEPNFVTLSVRFDAIRRFIASEPKQLLGQGRYVQKDGLDRTAHILAIPEARRRRTASELHDGQEQMLSTSLIALRNAMQAITEFSVEAVPRSASLEPASTAARNDIGGRRMRGFESIGRSARSTVNRFEREQRYPVWIESARKTGRDNDFDTAWGYEYRILVANSTHPGASVLRHQSMSSRENS